MQTENITVTEIANFVTETETEKCCTT